MKLLAVVVGGQGLWPGLADPEEVTVGDTTLITEPNPATYTSRSNLRFEPELVQIFVALKGDLDQIMSQAGEWALEVQERGFRCQLHSFEPGQNTEPERTLVKLLREMLPDSPHLAAAQDYLCQEPRRRLMRVVLEDSVLSR